MIKMRQTNAAQQQPSGALLFLKEFKIYFLWAANAA